MSANHRHAEMMRYCTKFEHIPNNITDIFDGSHYRSLLNTIVPASMDTNPCFYFSNPRDVALGPTSERLSKQYGIKGTPILSTLSSISFPASFPFDFMHLIWENLIPNLILFWTGNFKDLDHHDADYVIQPSIWNDIGKITASCKASIPSTFGAPVPNIAIHRSQMTSEMYANWTLFIAPLFYGAASSDQSATNTS